MQIIYGMRCGKRRMMEMLNKEIITQMTIDQMTAMLGKPKPNKIYVVILLLDNGKYKQHLFCNLYEAIEFYLVGIESSSQPDRVLSLIVGNISEPNTNSFIIGELNGVDIWVNDVEVLYNFKPYHTSVNERVNLLYFVGGAIFLDLAIVFDRVMPVCVNMLRASGVDVDNMDQSVLKENCINLYYDFKIFINDVTTNHYMPLDLNNAKAWLDKHIKEG